MNWKNLSDSSRGNALIAVWLGFIVFEGVDSSVVEIFDYQNLIGILISTPGCWKLRGLGLILRVVKAYGNAS